MRRKKQCRVFCGILLAGIIFTGVTPHQNYHHVKAYQSADIQIDALQNMVAWNQEYLAANTELSSVYSSQTMAELYATDFNDLVALKRAYSRFNAEREVIISRATAMFDALEPPERWNIEKSLFDKTERALYNAAVKQYEDIPALLENMREGSDFLPMIELMEAGDYDEAINGFIDKQLTANEQIVISENKQIDGYLLAIPKNHPNYQIQEIFKAVNLFGLEELAWTRLDLTKGGSLAERQKFADRLEKTLKNIPALLKRSETNFERTLKQLEKAKSARGLSAKDKAFIERVHKATRSFKDSIEVEEKLYANALSTVKAFRSDLIDEAFDAETDKIDLEFFALVEQRTDLVTERLALLQP